MNLVIFILIHKGSEMLKKNKNCVHLHYKNQCINTIGPTGIIAEIDYYYITLFNYYHYLNIFVLDKLLTLKNVCPKNNLKGE